MDTTWQTCESITEWLVVSLSGCVAEPSFVGWQTTAGARPTPVRSTTRPALAPHPLASSPALACRRVRLRPARDARRLPSPCPPGAPRLQSLHEPAVCDARVPRGEHALELRVPVRAVARAQRLRRGVLVGCGYAPLRAHAVGCAAAGARRHEGPRRAAAWRAGGGGRRRIGRSGRRRRCVACSIHTPQHSHGLTEREQTLGRLQVSAPPLCRPPRAVVWARWKPT